MRARHWFGLALWSNGEREEALTHFRDMLRLNPNDNQGIRQILMNCLLELGRDDEAAALMQRYSEDGSTEWLYSTALAAFRVKGDCAAARVALKQAIETNRHVPGYLWGKKKLPRTLPHMVAWGGVDEAIAYAHDGGPAWRASPGALEWAATSASTFAAAARSPQSKRPRRSPPP